MLEVLFQQKEIPMSHKFKDISYNMDRTLDRTQKDYDDIIKSLYKDTTREDRDNFYNFIDKFKKIATICFITIIILNPFIIVSIFIGTIMCVVYYIHLKLKELNIPHFYSNEDYII